MSFKSGFVTIVGRPNVGKSTLVNQILKQKVAIMSDKVQTTRRRLRGIFTDERGQIVFVDTPGIHKPIHKLGEFLMEETKLALPDADLVLFVVDATEPPGAGDRWIVQNIIEREKPVIMVVNKIDLVKDADKRKELVEAYKDLFEDQKVPTFTISAKTGKNREDLIKNLFRKLPKGPQYFPDDDVTDQSMRVIASETIREKILLNTSEELPHSIAVVIETFKTDEKMITIDAVIYVERDSQKGMIIGKNGTMLKKIGSLARVEIEEMAEHKVFLTLNVKVKKNWRKNPSALKQFGYKSEESNK
ncbi:MAG: GTPase Era [Vampirovibrionia bacterium]